MPMGRRVQRQVQEVGAGATADLDEVKEVLVAARAHARGGSQLRGVSEEPAAAAVAVSAVALAAAGLWRQRLSA